MSVSSKQSGRTNPQGNGEDSDSEDDTRLHTSSGLAKGRFRSKVIEYQNQSQFPTAPLYGINEEVYIIMAGQAQPAGPYLISSILANGLYRLRYKGTGDALNQSIAEKDLVIRTS